MRTVRISVRRTTALVAAVVALGLTAAGGAWAAGAMTTPDTAADPATMPSPDAVADATAMPSPDSASGPAPSTSVTPPASTPVPSSPAVTSTPGTATLTRLTYAFPAGSGGNLQGPLGIAASGGHVYVANTLVNVVSDLSGGTTTTVAGSLEATGEGGDRGPAAAATLNQPTGTAVDGAGDVYIADTGDNVIRRIDATTGIITRFAGTGRPGAGLPGLPATLTRLNAPQGVAAGPSGDVFVADTTNNRVLVVRPGGRVAAFAGDGRPGYAGDGGIAVRARLTEPTGVAVDDGGDVYIADAGDNVVRRVDARTGRISTVAGQAGPGGFAGDGGPATSARLYDPEGVALDDHGDLFIADTFNHAVRMVTPDGTISTVVNRAATYGSETAGPAAASRLNGPCAVAVDRSTGILYVADTRNNAVAEVTFAVPEEAGP